MMQAPLIN